MSNADFLKNLFLSAVGSGQIKAGTTTPDEATHVMESLMRQYLQAAQHMERLNRRVRKRVSPIQHEPIDSHSQDEPDWSARHGGALPS